MVGSEWELLKGELDERFVAAVSWWCIGHSEKIPAGIVFGMMDHLRMDFRDFHIQYRDPISIVKYMLFSKELHSEYLDSLNPSWKEDRFLFDSDLLSKMDFSVSLGNYRRKTPW